MVETVGEAESISQESQETVVERVGLKDKQGEEDQR